MGCCGKTTGVVLLTISAFFSIAVGITWIVLGNKYGDDDCLEDADTFMEVEKWLVVEGACMIAVSGFCLISLICAVIFEKTPIAGVAVCVKVLHTFFHTAWAICGAILLSQIDEPCDGINSDVFNTLLAADVIAFTGAVSVCCI